MKKLIIIPVFLSIIFSLTAQKKSLDHSVYDSWKNISSFNGPYNGRYLLYNINPQEGDGVLNLYDMKEGSILTLERGSSGVINETGEFMVCKVTPYFEETRQAKIKKKKEADMPKDSLAILSIKTGEVKKFANMKSHKTPLYLKERVAFLNSKDSLFIIDIKSCEVDTLTTVSSYFFDEQGDRLVYITKVEKKDTLGVNGIFSYNIVTKEKIQILSGGKKARFDRVSFSKDQRFMTFLAQLDTLDENKDFRSIYRFDLTSDVTGNNPRIVVSNDIEGMREGWMITSGTSVSFNESYTDMYIRTAPIPPKKDTTLVDFEQPKLDIWAWDQDYIPTIQAAHGKRMQNAGYMARVVLKEDGVGKYLVQLADEDITNVSVSEKTSQACVLAVSDKPYRAQGQWNSDSMNDIYKISLEDGKRELIKESMYVSFISQSPYGNYYTWFDAREGHHYLYNVTNGEIVNITKDLGVNFYREDHDTPSLPNAYGPVRWFEDEKALLFNDQYDFWIYYPAKKAKAELYTEGYGRKNNIRFNLMSGFNSLVFKKKREFRDNYIRWDEPLYFASFNKVSKEGGLYMKDITKSKAKLEKLVEGPHTYVQFSVSESFDGKKIKTPVYTFVKSDFENSPNLYVTRNKFKSEQKLTDINPQQREYNWGSVQLVNWMTNDDTPIRSEGMLFTPENLDPAKKYPMLIYFYEKDSDGLFRYRSPAPSRSTINIPFFVSNEYVVFVPDIYYTDGHPGQSAMKSIMPGVDMLLEKFPFIDEANMAIQGQSWGGYQVAYMVTQTDRFKAAGAGAPVGNMTSAYSGIRWGSGMARQFQYEGGQSRIGKDLWDGYDLYIENSPVFFLPNVKTPLLIMHNDQDDAVPWYQGIEIFLGLRRLGKPAWMLQYNGELHNLRDRKNAKDLSIRLEQFFGYYLKGAPMPLWMKEGIPFNKKGIDLGYELID